MHSLSLLLKQSFPYESFLYAVIRKRGGALWPSHFFRAKQNNDLWVECSNGREDSLSDPAIENSNEMFFTLFVIILVGPKKNVRAPFSILEH